MSKIHS